MSKIIVTDAWLKLVRNFPEHINTEGILTLVDEIERQKAKIEEIIENHKKGIISANVANCELFGRLQEQITTLTEALEDTHKTCDRDMQHILDN